MPRKSTKEDKNIYFKSREDAGYTREKACEIMNISQGTLERIEYGTQNATPYDVAAMADAYKKPSLPLLSNLNALNRDKDLLIDIASDGRIAEDELEGFSRITHDLEQMSVSIETMKLWIKSAVAIGAIQK